MRKNKDKRKRKDKRKILTKTNQNTPNLKFR